MTKREKTSYQTQMDGEEPSIPTFPDGKQVFYESLRSIFIQWFAVSLVLLIGLYLILRPSITDLFLFLSLANLILTIVMIFASGYSGNTAVQSPLLYVGGTGVEKEMRDAKKRANSFTMPLASFLHCIIAFLVFLGLSIIL